MIVYKGVSHPAMCDIMGHMTTRHYIAMFDDGSYHFLYDCLRQRWLFSKYVPGRLLDPCTSSIVASEIAGLRLRKWD